MVSIESILIVTARINLESAGDTGWTTAAEAGVDAEDNSSCCCYGNKALPLAWVHVSSAI